MHRMNVPSAEKRTGGNLLKLHAEVSAREKPLLAECCSDRGDCLRVQWEKEKCFFAAVSADSAIIMILNGCKTENDRNK